MDDDTVYDLDECKLAAIALKKFDQNIIFGGTKSESIFPKGCYIHWDPPKEKDQLFWHFGDFGVNIFWNTHTSGNANRKARPICKSMYIGIS